MLHNSTSARKYISYSLKSRLAIMVVLHEMYFSVNVIFIVTLGIISLITYWFYLSSVTNMLIWYLQTFLHVNLPYS